MNFLEYETAVLENFAKFKEKNLRWRHYFLG